MKKHFAAVVFLFGSSAFAGSGPVSISTHTYPSDIDDSASAAFQILANAAHAQCPNGVSDLTDISLQFQNTKAVVDKDAATPGKIKLGYAMVNASGSVVCK